MNHPVVQWFFTVIVISQLHFNVTYFNDDIALRTLDNKTGHGGGMKMIGIWHY